MQERTLAIIKPDAFSRNLVGSIIAMAEEKQLSMVSGKVFHLTRQQAESFYYVHRDKGFFESLTRFMSEGPIFVMVLGGEEAITLWRKIMGTTDPGQAEEGTIRQRFGENIERNSVHGSDESQTARFEIGFFFNALEVVEESNAD